MPLGLNVSRFFDWINYKRLLTWGLAKALKLCSAMSPEKQNNSQVRPPNHKIKWNIEKRSVPM